MQQMGRWVWAAVALAGCDRLETATSIAAIEECDGFLCKNSPELLYDGFHGFPSSGQPNEQGMWIRSVDNRPQLYDASGGAWDLHVEEHRIIGKRASGETLRGPKLKKATIVIDRESAPTFVIRIDAVREIIFPFGKKQKLDAYTMIRYLIHEPPPPPFPTGRDRMVCNRMPIPSPGEQIDDLLGMNAEEVVVFAGDFLDIHNARIWCNGSWINFGCAGHTLAKLLLTRNTCQSQERRPGDDEATLARARQATLKLLVADYCDIGAHFTVSGEPLVWKGGLITDFATDPTTLEARWNERGAICLQIPRLQANPAPPEAGFPPNIWTDIVGKCQNRTPPHCANTNPSDFDGALRVSANRLAL